MTTGEGFGSPLLSMEGRALDIYGSSDWSRDAAVMNVNGVGPLGQDKTKALVVIAIDATNLDTNGSPVPVWKMQEFSYDSSGNLSQSKVQDGGVTWIRTYTWADGVQTNDSGWVRQ